jgi:N-acetylglucosamine-6-phosphate deacetylase
MAAGGAGPGKFTIGSLQVEVGEDQVVRQPGRTNFAGSALRPYEGVARAARMLKAPWQDCWARMSAAPAKFMGIGDLLAVGSRADLCSIHAKPDGIVVANVIVAGSPAVSL